MTTDQKNVFISYAHADDVLVEPIVRLLRSNDSLVFRDTDDIRGGKKWSEVLLNAIEEADKTVLFWCDHSKNSAEVTKEWKHAIAHDKDVLPLLLDNTPLPEELLEYQFIDFRELARHEGKRWSKLSTRITGFAGFSVVLAGTFFINPMQSSGSDPVNPALLSLLFTFPILVFFGILLLVWRLLPISRRDSSEDMAKILERNLTRKSVSRRMLSSSNPLFSRVIKVWYGDYSLPRNFWLSHVCGFWGLAYFSLVIFENTLSGQIPYMFSLFFYFLVLVVGIISAVGVWRSASKRRGFWGWLSQFYVIELILLTISALLSPLMY